MRWGRSQISTVVWKWQIMTRKLERHVKPSWNLFSPHVLPVLWQRGVNKWAVKQVKSHRISFRFSLCSLLHWLQYEGLMNSVLGSCFQLWEHGYEAKSCNYWLKVIKKNKETTLKQWINEQEYWCWFLMCTFVLCSSVLLAKPLHKGLTLINHT